MRLHRVSVRHFKNIDAFEFEPATDGVTVLEGPNESGKSSIAQAIDLLFDEPDSTAKRTVRDCQPVGQDVGPEVEAEVSTGEYRFRYRKRFLKSPLTELEVMAPAPETRTGREAHDRVREILAGTMDLALWRALRVDQGQGAVQPDLESAPSLVEALGRVAGRPTGGEDQDLLARVRTEYLRFFTEKRGQPTRILGEARRRLDTATQAVQDLRTRLDSLHHDLRRRDTLEERRIETDAALAELERADHRAREARARFEELQQNVRFTEKGVEAARAELGRLQSEQQARLDARREQDEAAARVTELAAAVPGHETRTRTLAERVAATERELDAVRRDRNELESAWRHAAEREQRRADRARREDLDGRLAALDELDARLRSLSAEHDTVHVPADRIRRVRELDKQLETARASRDAAQPRLRLERLEGGPESVDRAGTSHPLPPDRPLVLDGDVPVEIPGQVRIDLEPGEELQRRRERVTGLERELAGLLEDVGVDAPAAFEVRVERAAELAGEITRLQAERRGRLGDSSPEAWRAERDKLAHRVGSGDREPEDTAADAPDPEELAFRREAAETRETALAARATGERSEAESAARALIRTQEELAEARRREERARAAVRPDSGDAFEVRLKAAQKKLRDLQQLDYDWKGALRTQEKNDPRARATRLHEELDATRAAREATLREMTQLDERLRLLGEEGLAGRLMHAERERDRAERDWNRLHRQAEAARLLWRVLDRERDASRERYAEPLRRAIGTLGVEVFGEGFRVDLDQDLRISHRTRDGRRLEFANLSLGAREQLGLLTRLAAATLVSEPQGAPIVFDDTLGHSDPERLDAMNRVLSRAGSRLQILVLTCMPGRYEVAGMRRVALATTAGAAAAG